MAYLPNTCYICIGSSLGEYHIPYREPTLPLEYEEV